MVSRSGNEYLLTLRKKSINNSYQVKRKDKNSRIIYGSLCLFLVIFVYFIFGMCTYHWERIRPDLVSQFVGQFFNYSSISEQQYLQIALTLMNTILLSVVTTIISSFIGLILGLCSAKNISNKYVANVIRAIAGFTRAVPTIIWVLIFVSGFGLSTTTALVGMSFHSIAYFIKSYSEAFEEVNEGTIEALRATGASWGQIVLNAILPSSLTKLISWIAMRSELNFAAAVIIGPAVGVPGTIGSIINKAAREGNYATMGICILFIVAVTLLFETVITKYKQKSIVSD